MKLDIILSKIKKLLALAADSNSPEAASAMEMAERLIAKYGIDRKEIEEALEEFTKQLIFSKRSVPKHELDLAIMVADFHDCVVVTAPKPKRIGLSILQHDNVFVTGKGTNVGEAVRHLEWLLGVVLVTYRKTVRRVKGVESTNPLYLRSYWEGVLDALDRRLTQEEPEPEDDVDAAWEEEAGSSEESVASQSTALVKTEGVLDEKESVRDWLRKNYAVRDQTSTSFQYPAALVDGQLYLCGQTLGRELEIDGYKTGLLPSPV